MYVRLQFFHQWCSCTERVKWWLKFFLFPNVLKKFYKICFLTILYRKSVQWVFQVCNMILGEGGEEESKIPFIFVFAIHPLFWNIRRKARIFLFSTHPMMMDTHSKLILSQDQSKVLLKINRIASFSHMIIKTTKETKENTHQNNPRLHAKWFL